MVLPEEYVTTTVRLLVALLAGGLVGLERSFNGRPAGFRTHALVCMSSSLLMLLTVYQWNLLVNAPIDTIRVDPTRMAQGLMTGIGFLGAGVIMKERFTIRGLTTAASIWVTASIGILIGMGFYFPALLATVLALGVLSLFRWFERRLPTLTFANLSVHTARRSSLSLDDLREILDYLNCKVSVLSYHLENEGKQIKYEMTLSTRNGDNFDRLAQTLGQVEEIEKFSVMPRNN
ncbi:MAG: MgtC/SapB family protein [Gammaproteobacteria bacterium]|nr:MgtC/SapB family protein [Gammaproteobacteria bacterium]